MHIEKNICDSLLGTLLNISSKTKDDLNARLDMIEIGIRIELASTVLKNGTFLPATCFTFSKKKKKQFCKILSKVKVSDGYVSNIMSHVQMKDSKLINLKSHN